jgi:hypothetical protein
MTAAKIWGWLMYVPAKVSGYLCEYPTVSNFLLLFWNAFSTSWATGIKAPINFDGLNFNIDARVWMTNLQYHTHLPTWTVAVLTLLLNGLVAYGNWRKTHPANKESK